MVIKQHTPKTSKSKRKEEKFRKHFQVNKIKNTVYQNLWDATPAVPRERCIPINTNIKKDEENSN